jgi:hypothetical protein
MGPVLRPVAEQEPFIVCRLQSVGPALKSCLVKEHFFLNNYDSLLAGVLTRDEKLSSSAAQ